MSWPTISRYTSLRRAVALTSTADCQYRAATAGTLGEGRTHVLAANLGATFFQAVLDVFLFVALVVPQPSDEVVKRLFEPAELSAEASVEAPKFRGPDRSSGARWTNMATVVELLPSSRSTLVGGGRGRGRGRGREARRFSGRGSSSRRWE